MKGIVYVSTARDSNVEVMRNLCEGFSDSNSKHNVTGVLIFASSSVIQYIEGEDEIVDRLYLNILRDTRHHNIITIFEEEIETRLFDSWGMKFHHSQLTDLKEKFKIDQMNILRSFVRSNFSFNF